MIVFVVILVLLDYYVYHSVDMLLQSKKTLQRRTLKVLYWLLPALFFFSLVTYNLINSAEYGRPLRKVMFITFSLNYIPKLFAAIFLLFSDVINFMRWGVRKISLKEGHKHLPGKPIKRSEFVGRMAILSAGAPLAAMGFGIVKGAHDYRIRRKTIYLPHLPKAFDGIRIGQVSDVHSGSFFNKTAVEGGVEMLLGEQPDLIFFTGDLVNNETKEINDYIHTFSKLKAPLGTFSVTGNHDYGDYRSWSSAKAKAKNFEDMIEAHKHMGYRLLMNETHILEQGGEKLAIIGIENWGAGRFQKYGKMAQAHAGSEDAAVKLLLSHDPSHWDAQVRPGYKDVDVMFSGHTHGFQFGVEIGNFQWSPSQYIYRQWAGLYEQNGQYLYVNRGFGYIGFPGRVGMPPELTIIELKRTA